MFLGMLIVGCVSLTITASYASQPPYFINRGDGGGLYLGGLGGATNVPIALSLGDAGQLKGTVLNRPAKPARRNQGVLLPGNVRLVLADPTKQIDVGGKQGNQQIQVATKLIECFLNTLNSIPSGNKANVNPNLLGSLADIFSQLQTLPTGDQDIKQHTETYDSTMGSSGNPLEGAHGSDVQVANSAILHSTAEETPTNVVVPVTGGEDQLQVSTKGLKQFKLRPRPGVVYLVPKRVSKGIEEEQDQSSEMDTTSTTPLEEPE